MELLHINLINETAPRIKTPKKLITALLTSAYAARRRKKAAVNLLIAGDEKITELNVKFLKHDFTTDVISFADTETIVRGMLQMGDIIVNAELASRLAVENGWKTEEELALYALHGFLHILGFDDHSEDNYRDMVKAQRAAFSRLGIVCRI